MPHHELLLVKWVNALFGPMVASALGALGFHLDPANPIPDYLVMCAVVVLVLTALSLAVRSRLSVEHPGKFQIVVEDLVSAILDMMRTNIGPKGPNYFPLVGTIGLFIFTANMIGKIPGFMSPTASINVTLGCAITVWVYYHYQGVKAQGPLKYLAHFAAVPGVTGVLAFVMGILMFIIEMISHVSRVMSLSLRLFGNVFGEEMVVAILASLVPFVAPLPMMVLGVITGTLQAFIFVLLTMIYLAGAVHTEHDHEHEAHDSHAEEHGHAHAPATA